MTDSIHGDPPGDSTSGPERHESIATTPSPSFTPAPSTGAEAMTRPVTLPTGRLIGGVVMACGAVGILWTIGCAATGFTGPAIAGGLASAGTVAAVSTLAILALTPWRPRSLGTWPLAWTAAAFGRLIVAIGGAALLYSRPQFGLGHVFPPFLLAYLAVMVVESMTYARAMAAHAPDSGTAPEGEAADFPSPPSVVRPSNPSTSE